MKHYTLFSPLALSAFFICNIMHAKMVEINSKDQFNKLIAESPAVVVKYSTESCGVCKKIKSPYENIVNNPELSMVVFAHVDANEHPDINAEIVGVPTFEYFIDGKKAKQDVGVADMSTFESDVTNYIKTNMLKAGAQQQGAEKMPAQISTDAQEAAMQAPAAQVETPAPAPMPEPAPAASEGMLAQLQAVLMTIVAKFKELFMGIINWIKGLFGK